MRSVAPDKKMLSTHLWGKCCRNPFHSGDTVSSRALFA